MTDLKMCHMYFQLRKGAQENLMSVAVCPFGSILSRAFIDDTDIWTPSPDVEGQRSEEKGSKRAVKGQ